MYLAFENTVQYNAFCYCLSFMVKLAEQMQASERQCKFANSQKIFLVYCPIVCVCAL